MFRHSIFKTLKRSAFFFTVIFAATESNAQNVEASTVYIECTRASDNARRLATGFFVSGDGLVVTAKHAAPDGFMCKAAIGSAGETPTRNLVPQARQSDVDATLLRMVPRPNEVFTYLKPRFVRESHVATSITGFGFPVGGAGDVSIRPGSLSSYVPDQRGLLQTTVPMASGMSGGPVILTTSGELIGMISGAEFDPATGLPSYWGMLSAEEFAFDFGLTEATLPALNESAELPAAEPITLVGQEYYLDDLSPLAMSSVGPVSNSDELAEKLSKLPDIDLVNATLHLAWRGGQPADIVWLTANSLSLQGSSEIRVYSRKLNVVANSINFAGGRLVAFPNELAAAEGGANASSTGQPGGNGADGFNGGSVAFYVVQQITGALAVDLSGQTGGRGGNGGAGNPGASGAPGSSGSDSLFGCTRGPGNGGLGGTGGDGAPGGDGGSGGNGGNLLFWASGDASFSRSINFVSEGGSGGLGGSGGVGGLGGQGGPRGSQTVFCQGGSDGPSGNPGSPGTNGRDGQEGQRGSIQWFNIETALSQLP